MTRRIEIVSRAQKTFRKIPLIHALRIRKAIDRLVEEPWPLGCVRMVGPQNTFRIRVGNYRVVYVVEPELITVVALGHRKEVYR